MNTNDRLMFISAGASLTFFGVANFTDILLGLNVVSAILQILINAFVFVVWTRGFLQSSGFKKFVAFFGVVVPFFMAAFTIYNVLAPLLF